LIFTAIFPRIVVIISRFIPGHILLQSLSKVSVR
jgi:hypothetical protein